MADEGPSLPSNYVTILHLKERWLKQQSNPNFHESDSQPTLKPQIDSTPKIPNEPVHRGKNRLPVVNQSIPDVNRHDSTSKSPKKSVHRSTNRNRSINQLKSHDSASETLTPAADNHPVVENTDQSNFKSSTSKSSSRGRNPRFVTDRIPAGGSTKPSEIEPVPEKKQPPEPEIVSEKKQLSKREDVPEPEIVQKKKQLPKRKFVRKKKQLSEPEIVPETNQLAKQVIVPEKKQVSEPEIVPEKKQPSEPETVAEKKQHRKKSKRRNWSQKQEVQEPEVKTLPLAQNDSGVVFEAVTAAVKEMRVTDVNQRTNRNWSSGRFNGGVNDGPAKAPLAQNDSGGGGEAVAAAVKEMRVSDVSQRRNRGWSSGKFNGGPAKAPVAVWVRKGEYNVQN